LLFGDANHLAITLCALPALCGRSDDLSAAVVRVGCAVDQSLTVEADEGGSLPESTNR
jgi:hypothetical protein